MRTPAIIASVALALTTTQAWAEDATGKRTNAKGEPTDKLHPVRPPAPPERPGPAYQLYWEIDAPILTVAIVFGIARSIRAGLAPSFCAPVKGSPVEQTTFCDPQTLNWLDRHVAGRYQPSWNRWSDVGLYGIAGLAGAGILAHEWFRPGLNDLAVVAEATLIASAASGVSTAITGRPRPYMYGLEAPTSVRQNGDGGMSFFSGHTSTAFAAVTSTFVTLRRLHPDDRWPWYVLAGGVMAAGFVGATRVLSGSHFPTDVAAGAAVGVAIGVLVPALHSAPRRMTAVPMAMASGGGLAITGDLP